MGVKGRRGAFAYLPGDGVHHCVDVATQYCLGHAPRRARLLVVVVADVLPLAVAAPSEASEHAAAARSSVMAATANNRDRSMSAHVDQTCAERGRLSEQRPDGAAGVDPVDSVAEDRGRRQHRRRHVLEFAVHQRQRVGEDHLIEVGRI